MSAARRKLAIATGVLLLIVMAFAGSMALAQDGHDHETGTPESLHGGDHGDHAMVTPGTTESGMASTGTGVVYLTITNDGDTDDTLLDATTDRAEQVVIHETIVENDVGRMVPRNDLLVVPAGEAVAFEPGGLHMMLVNLTDDIRPGDTFEVTLMFENAGEVVVPVTAAFDAEGAESDPVSAGDLTIEGVWSRPAPRIDGMSGTPVASPAAQD